MHVVHERVGGLRVRGGDRDLHARRPEHAALLRHDELDVRVVLLKLDRVARPAEGNPGVALG